MPQTRLEKLRSFLKRSEIDGCIIPNRDPHYGEKTSGGWNFVEWLTGFTGSSATLVVTDRIAGLWTDSRYSIQAGLELEGSGFSLIKAPVSTGYDLYDWLRDNLNKGQNLAIEGSLIPIKEFRTLKDKLSGTFDAFLTDISISDQFRPGKQDEGEPVSAFEHTLKYAGIASSEKAKRVREVMREKNITHHLLTVPDDIMWLLNIRGGDYEFNPVLRSYALIGQEQIILFTDENKIPGELIPAFKTHDIVLQPYEMAVTFLAKLPSGSSVLIDPEKTSVLLFDSIPRDLKIVEGTGIPASLKVIRNSTELSNLSEVMLLDGKVLTRFFFRVEMNSPKTGMTEHSLALEISRLRAEEKGFLCMSFAPIVAFNEHSAFPHYSPSKGSDFPVNGNGVLLVDTGSHYMGGTTDITRTIALGKPTIQQKTDFTLVLKGHINLARSKFPAGTKGYQLDILARQFLWEHGLNYGHGTGHGVGYCLNVHEGPQNISPAANRTAIEPGMILSNEPAVYREGYHGIRTENLMVCYEDEETDFGSFLKFDTLSLCYLDKNLIDRNLLTADEIRWINSYHATVFGKLSPLLNSEEKNWLWEKTSEL